ncbi:MAG: hypothetical protein IPL50_19300 [Chitinophagaceae bacterium]|nr:hypothetical protein [Chitinophagaceae bacterium]
MNSRLLVLQQEMVLTGTAGATIGVTTGGPTIHNGSIRYDRKPYRDRGVPAGVCTTPHWPK